jgi:hypothetical protein
VHALEKPTAYTTNNENKNSCERLTLRARLFYYFGNSHETVNFFVLYLFCLQVRSTVQYDAQKYFLVPVLQRCNECIYTGAATVGGGAQPRVHPSKSIFVRLRLAMISYKGINANTHDRAGPLFHFPAESALLGFFAADHDANTVKPRTNQYSGSCTATMCWWKFAVRIVGVGGVGATR